MTEPRKSGSATTNTVVESVAKCTTPNREFILLGDSRRNSPKDIALAESKLFRRLGAGSIGRFGPGKKDDLHFTLMVSDSYSGLFGFDGQPTLDSGNRGLIRTNYYRNVVPNGVLIEIDVLPPKGMSKSVFAQELVVKAYSFASYTLDYSAPAHLVGSTMVAGQYNSSSFVSGLLNSVMGYVPQIQTPGYQAPGWEAPIPSSYFESEALR